MNYVKDISVGTNILTFKCESLGIDTKWISDIETVRDNGYCVVISFKDDDYSLTDNWFTLKERQHIVEDILRRMEVE